MRPKLLTWAVKSYERQRVAAEVIEFALVNYPMPLWKKRLLHFMLGNLYKKIHGNEQR